MCALCTRSIPSHMLVANVHIAITGSRSFTQLGKRLAMRQQLLSNQGGFIAPSAFWAQ